MKLKSLLFAVCVGLTGHAMAANQHMHPKANEVNNNKSAVSKPSLYPGYCQIEVKNRSNNDVSVYGMFDDGAILPRFMIPRFDAPHYIDLYYYGYCHAGMRITIESISFPYNVVIYDQYTATGSIVDVVPYLANGVKKGDKEQNVRVEVKAK